MYWFLTAMSALCLYGAWGFFSAQTSALIDAKSGLLYSSIGTLIAGFICLIFLHFKPTLTVRGMGYGILTGLCTGFGSLFFIAALRQGPTIPVVMITALYPLVTILLALCFLHQPISLKQSIGVAFSLVALLCFA